MSRNEEHIRANCPILSRVCCTLRAARTLILVLLLTAASGYAQTDPWSATAAKMGTIFTGPIAKGFSLVAIVLGGLHLAFGDGSGKRAIGGLIFGLGLALGAANFLIWITS